MNVSIQPSESPPRAWLDVDLSALRRNAERYQLAVGAPLLPMIKADGYGLGARRVARALVPLKPWGFGVATIAEARDLRADGCAERLVTFTPLGAGEVDAARAAGVRPVIGDVEALDAWTAASDEPFHVEIDTGMSRSGFRWHDLEGIAALKERLADRPGFEGIFTHFHSADSDAEATREQWERFQEVVGALPRRPELLHAANSAAGQAGTRYAADLARPGIYLYGGRAGSLVPEPVAALRARVVALRRLRPDDSVSYGAEALVEAETTIATLAIGYADGVPRGLGSRGAVEIGDRVAPIVGRVTMDMLMVDVEDAEVAVGDVATLFGGLVSVDEQATLAGTVAYELLAGLTARVTRTYMEGPG